VAKAVGRLGLVARGVVYCIIAGLALRIAFGKFEEADKRGALQSIVRQPFGRFMLVALTIGFAAYAASCFVKAAAGAAEGGKPLTGASGTAKRVAVAGQGVIYVLLVVTTLAVALTGGSGGQGGASQQDWTAKLLRHPFGQIGSRSSGSLSSASASMSSTRASANRSRRTCGQTRCHPGAAAQCCYWGRWATSPAA
jgi:hypothetical protein